MQSKVVPSRTLAMTMNDTLSVVYNFNRFEDPVELWVRFDNGIRQRRLSIEEFHSYVRMILRARDALRSVDPNASR